MKVLSGALSLLAVLLLASCTSLGKPRWASAREPAADRTAEYAEGFTADGRVQQRHRTASDVPALAAQSTVDLLDDVTRTGSLSLQYVYTDTDSDGLPDKRLPASKPKPKTKTKFRKMIYSASLQMRVSSVEDAVQRLLDRVGQLEGYLAQRNNNTLTCRIPATSFQTLVQEVKEYGAVLQESMQAQDVTKKHMDLSIRLENAETARKRLLKLLEKATKVEDILKIEEQLTRLTETIERIKGELKYLNEQVAYSLVSVGFHSVSPSTMPKRRSRSRFDWINQVGIEQVLRRF